MATLHVRNVPDELYEALWANAAVEGRSIGAQTVTLLQRALEDRASVRERVRTQIESGLGRVRFLKTARRAVVHAQEEVRALGHQEVGTEHLLLGLLRDGGELAATLARPPLSIAAEDVRRRVVELRPPGEPPTGRIAFSAEAKQALEAALRESLALRHRHIGVEHVLLGVAAVEESAGAAILRDLGADRDTLRATLLVAGPPVTWDPGRPPEAEWEYHAVGLSGSPQDWTTTLNDVASEGWELVSIVPQPEPRAVLRRPGTDSE